MLRLSLWVTEILLKIVLTMLAKMVSGGVHFEHMIMLPFFVTPSAPTNIWRYHSSSFTPNGAYEGALDTLLEAHNKHVCADTFYILYLIGRLLYHNCKVLLHLLKALPEHVHFRVHFMGSVTVLCPVRQICFWSIVVKSLERSDLHFPLRQLLSYR